MTGGQVDGTESGVVVISPQGRLDAVSGPVLRKKLHERVESGDMRLVVDLSGVDLIDSAGLSALLSGLRVARQAGGNLQITRPSKAVSVLLKLTNLHRVLEPYEPEGGPSHEQG